MTRETKPNVAARRLAGAVIAALAASSGIALAQPAPRAGAMERGYVNSPQGVNYRTAYGQCWRAGHWTPAMAAEPCDAVVRASAPAPIATAPQPAPAPEPPRPVIQRITLETDVLFEFDKAQLRESGKHRLDEIAAGLKGAEVEEIVAVGHADRIASERYNQKLSEERAAAVKSYLSQQGVPAEKIVAEGRGEEQPVTGDDCSRMGPERGSNRKLVNCLQPDRRVEIEVFGSREIASGEQQPAAGATSGGASGSGSAGSSR